MICDHINVENPKAELQIVELPLDIIFRTPHNFELIIAVTGTTLAGLSTIQLRDTTDDDYLFESISIHHPAP